MDTAQKNAEVWLNGNFDEETKAEIRALMLENPSEITEAFYKNLEFGTGGLRGIMGIGTNRMNKYTVGMCTQGYAQYLNKVYPGGIVRVAIAHDSRNNSRYFAEIVADVMAANGIKVFLFDDLRPTPELSFAIRHLGCQGGVVCTASHNPKEYNGYKAYWSDGGQLVPPHDKNVINEVANIKSVDDVKWSGNKENIQIIGAEVDEAYLKMAANLSVNPDVIKKQQNLKIVYTPIHGTGIKLIPALLEKLGFRNVTIVKEQEQPDGNFPTVNYPNPEESEAMKIGLNIAREIDADILAGTDPDADRLGIGVKDSHGNWVLLNGNQTAVLAFNYLIESRIEKGLAKPNDMVVKTIVTTNLIDDIARMNHITCYNVLTGFKWIAELIRQKEGKENYIIGGEESFGLMIGDQIRDKDAVTAVAMLCEMAAVEKEKGKTLFEKLIDIYIKYGFYKERLLSITKKGIHGQKEIAEMIEQYRTRPPETINGLQVTELFDYETGVQKNLLTGETSKITLPKSNVIQFILSDGSKITARPSGTEPKIKFYFSIKHTLENSNEFDLRNKEAEDKIDAIIKDMGF